MESTIENEIGAPAHSSDEEIVARVRAGDVARFEELIRRHNQRLYRAARAILRDDSEAEDVMQDTYVRAYEHLHEFEGRARFSTWLTRIAVNEALARVRRKHRFVSLEPDRQDRSMPTRAFPTPEQQASDVELRSVLEAAIAKLPDEFRAVFVLRAVEGMSGAETADCLGISEETVKTRLHRARGRLQETLLESVGPAVTHAYEFHLSRCDRVVANVMRRITQP